MPSVLGDIGVDNWENPQMLQVKIKQSKTDPIFAKESTFTWVQLEEAYVP